MPGGSQTLLPRAGAGSFVGRRREIEVLTAGLDGLALGRGSLFLVSGEPGIGKTRLVDELSALATARGVSVAWGAAWDGGGAPALWPWIEVVRALRPALPEPDPELRRDLGPLWGDPGGAQAPEEVGRDPDAERFRRLDALRAALTAAAARAPWLVVLEDLHAADHASLLALDFVARSLRGVRALVVGTHREAEVRLDPALADLLARIARQGSVVRLGPLARSDVAQLVAELDPVPPRLADEVYDATAGNPLFVDEMLRHVRTGGRVHDVPERVGAVIGERLARFAPATRAALEAASVLGREFDPGAVAQLCGATVDEVATRLRPARLGGVVEQVAGGGLRFSHPLFRERLYEELGTRRAALHLAAGEVLARRGTVGLGAVEEAVARHLLAALPAGDPDVASRWAARAAASARAALAFDRAAAFLEGALSALDGAPPDPARRMDLELDLAAALVACGAGARSRVLCQRTAELARTHGDARRLALAALGYGGELRIGVVDPTLVGLLEEALRALGHEEPALRARVLARLAAARQPAADPEVPMRLAREAVALARRADDAGSLLSVLDTASSALGSYAPPRERLHISRELVARALVAGDLVLAQRGRARVAVDASDLCDLEEVEASVEAHERLGAALGHARWQWRSPLLRSMLALARGAWEISERALAQAGQLVAEVGGDDPMASLSLAVHRIGAIRARESGPASDASDVARTEPGLASYPMMAALVRASTHARFNELDAARRVLAGIAEPIDHIAVLPNALALLADVVVRVGDRERAAAVLPGVMALGWPAIGWASVGYVWDGPTAGWIGGLLGVLGRWDEAVSALDDALATAAGIGARPAAAHLRCELARALLARRGHADGDRALALLGEATDEAKALSMQHLAARVEEVRASAAGAARGRAAAIASPDPPFTLEREGEVWAVTSQGRTVRLRHSRALEILDELVRHPGKEFHVLDLGGPPGGPLDAGDAGEALDATARAAYRRRLAALEEELREAESWSDTGRCERLRAELEFLQEELARGVGLGGRSRRAASAAERARVNVQKRLRGLIKRIAAGLPEVGRHLEREVRTGLLVSYRGRS